jgi:hypothetical protein
MLSASMPSGVILSVVAPLEHMAKINYKVTFLLEKNFYAGKSKM